MGLDWHSQVEMSVEEQIEWTKKEFPEVDFESDEFAQLLREEAPKHRKPCKVVKAPTVKERKTFKEDYQKILDSKMEQVATAKLKDEKLRNEGFITYWENMTLEKLMEDDADKFDCQNCPLIKELSGADSSGNLFLGITVSSCDFRGKRIGSNEFVSEELSSRAYDEQEPWEMLEYANELEGWLNACREDGDFEMPSYAEYKKEWEEDDFSIKDPLLSKEEYKTAMHWAEEALVEAIHWLRVCANHGIMMGTSY